MNVQVHILLEGLRPGSFAYELARHQITDFTEVRSKAQEFIRVEEYKGSRAEENQEKEKKQGKNKKPVREEEKRQTQQQSRGATYGRPRPRFEVMQTERAPARKEEKEGQEKFCQYHKWAGHNTEDCKALKGHIDQLIKEGAPRRPNEETRRDDRCKEDRYKRRRPDQSPPREQRRRRTPERRGEEREREQREHRGREEKEATSRGNREGGTTSRNAGWRESQCSAVVKHGYINMIFKDWEEEERPQMQERGTSENA